MAMEQKVYKLATHNLRFHADDIFACAILSMVIKREGATYTLSRTRDPEIISQADIVFDVGGIYDVATKRFDHHQKGGAGERANGIPYASCGLVWKTYGDMLTGNPKITQKLDEKVFQPIDLEDNGKEVYTEIIEGVSPFTVQNLFYSFRTTWKEDDVQLDVAFVELVALAEKVLERLIIRARDSEEARVLVDAVYQKTEDKRVIVFDTSMPAEEVLMEYPEPLFMVLPNTDGGWRLVGVSAEHNSFKRRKDMPKEWAGLMNADLAKVTGVEDAVFCHNGLWLAVAKSKEGILKLAKLALEA